MEMFIVKPNLELLNCQDHSHQALVDQKSVYLQRLSKVQSLCHSHRDSIPKWCHDSSLDVDCSSLALGRRTSVVSADSHRACDLPSHRSNCLNLDLQSIVLTDDLIKSKEDYPIDLLHIPSSLSRSDLDWIDLKKLQLDTDIALVEYKYKKAINKLNTLIKSKFSKAELTPEEEEEGMKVVSKECDKYKYLENILRKLTLLKRDLASSIHI